MKRSKLLSPKWWILAPIAALLVVAIACGDDKAPAPARGVDTAAISSAVESAVTAAVARIPAAEAPEIDTAAIQSAVEAAVAAVPEGASAAEIQAVVEKAVAAAAQPGATKEEVAAIVTSAVAEATAAQPEVLTAADVKEIVEGALAAEPTAALSPGEADLPKKGRHIDAVALSAKYGPKPKYGGKFLNAVFENLPHHDWQQGRGANLMIQSQLYNGLLMTNAYNSSEIMPDLAHSWEISPDGKTYTFHLFEGVKFHDGTPMTSEDFRFSFNRIITKGVLPGFEEPTCAACKNTLMLQLLEGFEAPDANTLVVKMKGPSGLIFKIFTNTYASVMPKHVIEADPVNGLKTEKIPAGTGPFRVTKEPTTVLWTYERNPDYFKPDLPFVDEMESHLILDGQTRATAVLTERVHWNSLRPSPFLPVALAKALSEQDPGIVWETIPTFQFHFLTMNTTRPPLDDVRVRQAISEAIDRNTLSVDGLGEVSGVIGSAIFPRGEWAYPPGELEKLIGYGPDMEVRRQHARDLLADYEAENGKIDWKNTIRFSCASDHPSCPIATLGQDQLKKVGIDIDLKVGETSTTWGNHISGDFDISGMLANVDFDDPVGFFAKQWVTGGIWAFSRLFDPEIDDLWASLVFMTDKEQRRKIAYEIDEWAMNVSGMNILLWSAGEHIQRDYVNGWTAFSDNFNTNQRLEYLWLDLPETRATK